MSFIKKIAEQNIPTIPSEATSGFEDAEDGRDEERAQERIGGRMKRFVTGIFIVVFIATATSAAYFYTKYEQLRKSPQRVAQEEVRAVTEEVGKLIVLPEGETPTVATVTDVERLKNQPFFAAAMNGDKVLIYTNIRKALLYRPGAHKLIEVAPLNLGTP